MLMKVTQKLNKMKVLRNEISRIARSSGEILKGVNADDGRTVVESIEPLLGAYMVIASHHELYEKIITIEIIKFRIN